METTIIYDVVILAVVLSVLNFYRRHGSKSRFDKLLEKTDNTMSDRVIMFVICSPVVAVPVVVITVVLAIIITPIEHLLGPR